MVISYLCDATTTNIAVNDVKSVSSPKSLGVCKLLSMREIKNGMEWYGMARAKDVPTERVATFQKKSPYKYSFI
jgi:hypothetical protein